MPHRLFSLAILLFWAVAAGFLVTRDVLPELLVGDPPDLRTVSSSKEPRRSAKWVILVSDDPQSANNLRAVGQAVTETIKQRDGWVQINSEVWFDPGNLLKATPMLGGEGNVRIEVRSTYEIDPAGNLYQFRTAVRPANEREDLLTIDGILKSNAIEVHSRGPMPMFRWTRTFPYQARGMVQSALDPLDRMPGLHVGQSWESRVVNPLTGRVETVRVKVPRTRVIHWDKAPITTLEVVTQMTPISLRTLVRPDGLVVRQEVPFLNVTLILERSPDQNPSGLSEGAAR